MPENLLTRFDAHERQATRSQVDQHGIHEAVQACWSLPERYRQGADSQAKTEPSQGTRYGLAGAVDDCWLSAEHLAREKQQQPQKHHGGYEHAGMPPEYPPVTARLVQQADASGRQRLQFNIAVNENRVAGPFEGMQDRMMSIVNQSYDRQMTEAAGAVLPALINGLGDIAGATLFLSGAVKDVGEVLCAGVQIGKVNATPFDERLRNLLDKYRPVADSMQRAYAPVETDLEDIGAKGESNPITYARMVTDPIKAAGGALEGFSRQSPADQVAALMRVDGQIVCGGALTKAGEGIAEATPVAFRSGVKALREKMDLFHERHAAIREQFQIRQPQFAYAGAFAWRGAREYEGVLKMSAAESGERGIGRSPEPQEIVNPIDRSGRQFEKIGQLQQLSIENEPLINDFTQKLDAKLGTSSSPAHFKAPEDIQLKSERPDIKEKKPWFEVEHIRDALRFKTVADNLDILPQIVKELKNSQFKVINPDFDKLLRPKGRGWRMVALDLRAPNGQIIEYQIMPPEMSEAGKMEHTFYKDWREKDMSKVTREERDAKVASDKRAAQLYRNAWMSYLLRTGQSETSVRTVIDEAAKILSE